MNRGKSGKQVEKWYGASWIKPLPRFAVSLRPSENCFRRPFFRAALTGITQTLRHAVDGQVNHQQGVRIVGLFA